MDNTKFSKTQIAKKLIGKTLPKNVLKRMGQSVGEKPMTQKNAKIAFREIFYRKSPLARKKIYKAMNFAYKDKKKIEDDIFVGKKTSLQLKKEEKAAALLKARNIKLGKAAAENIEARKVDKGSIQGLSADSSRLGVSGKEYTVGGKTYSTQDLRGKTQAGSGSRSAFAKNTASASGLTRGSGAAASIGGQVGPSSGGSVPTPGGTRPIGL